MLMSSSISPIVSSIFSITFSINKISTFVDLPQSFEFNFSKFGFKLFTMEKYSLLSLMLLFFELNDNECLWLNFFQNQRTNLHWILWFWCEFVCRLWKQFNQRLKNSLSYPVCEIFQFDCVPLSLLTLVLSHQNIKCMMSKGHVFADKISCTHWQNDKVSQNEHHCIYCQLPRLLVKALKKWQNSHV